MWLILRVRHDKNGKFWPMIKRREKKIIENSQINQMLKFRESFEVAITK